MVLSLLPQLLGLMAQPENFVVGGHKDGPLKFELEIADFLSLFARSDSAITPSKKKVQLTLIGSPLRAFQ